MKAEIQVTALTPTTGYIDVLLNGSLVLGYSTHYKTLNIRNSKIRHIVSLLAFNKCDIAMDPGLFKNILQITKVLN